MAQKKSFLIHYDAEHIISMLSDEDAGKVFKALFPYARDGTLPDFKSNPVVAMAFEIFKLAIDRDTEAYNQKCMKNRENIRKRWNKSNTEEYERNKSYTNHTDTDNDSDSDNYNDIYNTEYDGISYIPPNTNVKTNAFHNFEQRNYDYTAIEKKLGG